VKKPKNLSKDPNKLAYQIVKMSTEESEEQPKKERSPISEYLAEIGRKGGLKGGKVRAQRLTAKRRQEIAQEAARKRWNKKNI
jgi:hypothetical protein